MSFNINTSGIRFISANADTRGNEVPGVGVSLKEYKRTSLEHDNINSSPGSTPSWRQAFHQVSPFDLIAIISNDAPQVRYYEWTDEVGIGKLRCSGMEYEQTNQERLRGLILGQVCIMTSDMLSTVFFVLIATSPRTWVLGVSGNREPK